MHKNFTHLLRIASLLLLLFIPFLVNAQFPAPYCAETFPSDVEPISKVEFANISNITSAVLGGSPHEDFTAIVGNVLIGSTYSMKVQGNTGGNFTTYVRVFIDWNNNGLFTDAGESFDIGTIANSTGVDGIIAMADILIPATATPGNLRMRVSKKFNDYATPCNNSGYGQAEDYTLSVIPPTACSGKPVAGTVSTAANVCANTNFNLALAGTTLASGLTYTWQSSLNNIAWANIGSTASLIISQSTTSFYRAIVKCTSSDLSDTAASVQVISPPLVSGTFTINGALATGSGNFQTFTEAVSYIQCGINGPVTFNVAPGSGPYMEQVVIPQIGGASATNRVTFNGNGTTLSYASTNTANRAGIHLNGADYVTIDSLIIDGAAGTFAWGVVLTGQADSNIIRKCTINIGNVTSTSTNFYGIVLNGSATGTASSGNNGNGNQILNNMINGGYNGIYLYGNSTSTTQNINNIVSGNIITDFYQYGIYGIYQSLGLVVRKNDLSRPSRTNSTTCAGVYITIGSIGVLVEKNRVHNFFDAVTTPTSLCYAIWVSSTGTVTQPNRLINNLVYNMGGNGTLYGIYNSTSPFMLAYHNTISLDGQAATTGAAYGFYQTGSAAGIDFRNNLISITRSGTGIKRCIHFNTTTSTITSNRNVLYMNAPSGTTNFLGQYGTVNYSTLADWKSANSAAYDQQSISVDPIFLNPGAADYTPQDAGINGLGANVGVTTDILERPRTGNPDPGAFEFTVIGTDGALTWVSPTAGPSASGLKTIIVNLANTQTATITSANLSYSNGTSVVTQSFTGLNITAGNSQQLSFTTQYNLVSTSTLRAYINLVNGVTDNSQVNDTTAFNTYCLQIAGVFTINNALAPSSTNFQSFTAVAEQLACGGVSGPVVFNVAPGSGPYNEQMILPQIPGTSATNTVTFNGNGATLSFNSANTNSRAGIHLNGADYVIIDSLIIDGSAGTFAWGIALTNQADSNIIRKCVINIGNVSSTSTNFLGIAINGVATGTSSSGNNGNGNQILNNTINGGYYGVYLYGNSVSATQNINNIVRGNIVTDFYNYGVYAIYQSSGLKVQKNDFSRPTRTNSTTCGGVFATTGCIGVLIEKNRVHNLFDAFAAGTSTSYGVYIGSTGTVSEPNRIINNLVYNMGGNGAVYGIFNATSPFMMAYHNTISLDGQAATTGAAYGFYQTGAASDIDFRNNLISVTRSGTGIKRCIYFLTTTSTITSNRNVLFMNAPSGTTNFLGQYGTTNYSTLADWQTANTNVYDQQSVSADPMFLNPGGGNYSPATSIVDNVGFPLGVLTDILDSARSTTGPDAGAYEFSTLTSGLNVGAEGMVTPAVAATGCYTNAETITIRIRNSRTSTHNFATNPVTVTTNVTGAVTQTFSATINTGTLASDVTMNVPMTATLNMTIPGVYTFNANTTLAGDVNTANDAMIAVNRTKAVLAPGMVSSSPTSYCINPGAPTLSLPTGTGYSSVKWQQSNVSGSGFADIPGANTSPYTLSSAITQTMYYKAIVGCGTNNVTSSEAMVALNNPLVTGTTPGYTCGTGTVTLKATGNAGATINWYAAATGGSSLYAGNTFVTPSISTSTTYYAAAELGGGGAPQQLDLLPLAGGNGCSGGNMMNITPSTNVDLTGFIVNTSVTTGTSTPVSIYYKTGTYVGSELVQASWTLHQTVNATSAGANAATMVSINPLSLTGGQVYGIYVNFDANYTNITTNTNYLNGDINVEVGVGLCGLFTGSNALRGFNGSVIYTKGCSSTPRTSVLATVDNSPGCVPLPVSLVSFTGEKQGSINKLAWTTSTEINNAGFELERSADGRNFSKLGFVISQGDNGNSNRNLNYIYNDERPLSGNGYYRLKQIDKDGKFSYSNIVLIKGSKVTDISITSLYPNPAATEINLVISSPTSEKVTLVVTDMTGKIISQIALQVSTGDNLQKLQVSQLASGTYFIKTICASGCESAVQKFVKQ